ncbi:hypothetical protein ACEQ8H_007973 [Pleosporales sp. CAS-2024a]
MGPKKARDRKRQAKINFSPAAKSSATPPQNTVATPAKATSSRIACTSKASSSTTMRTAATHTSSEDELAAETYRGMSLGMPTTFTEHGMFGSSDVDRATSETSDDEHPERNLRVNVKLASQKRQRAEDSDLENDVGITIMKTKRRRRRAPESEALADEELRLPRSKQRRVNRNQPAPSDEDEDDVATVQVTRASRSERNATVHQTLSVQDEQSPPRRNKRRVTRRPVTPSDESEQDDAVEEQSGRELTDGDSELNEEHADLKADLAFLRSSPLPDRGKLRSAHDKPKNERQKALEALKKRRAGTAEPSSSATPARNRRIIIESESESELEIIKEAPETDAESDVDVEDDEEIDESDRDANALDMFLEDEEDEAFIDNDVDAIIGEPVLGPSDFMPLILGRMSSSKPRELFKYAIEWMVMKKVHPGFDSNSEVYNLTFRKLDDEVQGLAHSKFSSAAWTPDFTRVLRARPNLMIVEITRTRKDVMDAHCEACNRRNHPASDELMFTGKPYNKDTLEPLDNDSDSDSNEDSDSSTSSELSADSEAELNVEKATYDAQGARLPPENKTYTVGSTCKANAQAAHTLHHWRYHLYSWVKDYLAREGHLTAEKLVKRDGWSDKKREKAALKIVKHMEAKGEVMKLYKLYKDQMTYAAEVRHDLSRNYRGRG